jgi:DNA topoisomerase-1
LVVVESPSKASTIEKYLSGNYKVLASLGHIRDLASDSEDLPDQYQDKDWAHLGVNVEDDFEPFYVTKKEDRVGKLENLLDKADELYLATDEDREGEAISWHLEEVLDPSVPVHRMTFHEITKSAIQDSLQNTRDIDKDLVHAQEARRILDRLVGFPLSHFVGEKIKFGLSAGRVQSVATRLLVEKEQERREFTKTEYWDLRGEFTSSSTPFQADLQSIGGQKMVQSKDFDSKTGELKNKKAIVMDKSQAEKLKDKLEGEKWRVESVKENSYTSSPKPPYITSTLQRDASRKLNMSASYTMSAAQKLYENGLITYMRTDDVSLSDEALKASRKAAYKMYDDEYVHDKTRKYSSKGSAQQAHEAIRPTGSTFTYPNSANLSGKQYSLYRMIWQRTVASQMADAKKTSIKVHLVSEDTNEEVKFKAKGSRVDFAGYIAAYYMGKKNPEKRANKNNSYPAVNKDDIIDCTEMEIKDHETRPPRRYTEPSLIKKLEKKEIGRPSTYASIMRNITKDGKYARKEGKTMIPTFMGIAVTELLKDYFPDLVDMDFTAEMENTLDEIAEGKKDHKKYLEEFWTQFEERLEEAKEEADSDEVKTLPLHSFPATMKVGYYGPYVEVDDNGETKTVSIPEDYAPDELNIDDVMEHLREKERPDESVGTDPDTGLGILVKDGNYGPYIQLGEHDDNENPDPKTASIPDSLKKEDIDVDLALKMFDLPRELGDHPRDGKPVETGIGPYGPYIRHNKEGKAEYKSLSDVMKVFNITMDEAMDRFQADVFQDMDEHPETGQRLRILDGPYGPYIKCGDDNYGLPDGADPEEIDKDEVLDIISKE